MSTKTRIGVGLVVKNEVVDIISWVAWHAMLGIDNFYIFDDHSTDGTFAVLQTLANIYNIRLEQTDLEVSEYFYFRQEYCYKRIISLASGQVEWLLFVDADEYIRLERDENLHAFVERYGSYDAICINWCTYGSNGHVIRPKLSPIEAFTRRSPADDAMNRHVKSCIRPDKVGQNWINVHVFDVDPDRQVLVDYSQPEWTGIPGIIRKTPNFDHARIMHFQCKSMEQFVERAKKRTDIVVSSDLWSELNTDEINDPIPEHKITIYQSEIKRIVNWLIEYCSKHMAEADDIHGVRFIHASPHYLEPQSSGTSVDVDAASANLICLVPSGDDRCVLFSNANGSPQAGIFTNSSFPDFLSSSMKYDASKKLASFEFVSTGKYVTAVPAIHGGHVQLSSAVIQSWELFDLFPLKARDYNELSQGIRDIFNMRGLIKQCGVARAHIPTNSPLVDALIELISLSDISEYCIDIHAMKSM